MWLLLLGLVMFVVCAVIGAIAVVYFAHLLRKFLFHRMSFAVSLAVSNAVIVTVSIALYPIFVGGIPFDDLDLSYYFVPGIHIYLLGAYLAQAVEPSRFTLMSPHQASVVGVVIIPGIVYLLLGSSQWYLIGRLSQWLSPNRLKPIPK